MKQAYKKAYTEILEIIKYLPHNEYEKIPEEKLKFYEKYKDSLYQFEYNPNKSLNEQNVSRETKVLIVDLFKETIATKTQKEKLNILLLQNEKEYQNKLYEKYSYDKLFNKRQNRIIVENKKEEKNENINNNVTVYKENIFFKVYQFLKSIFNKKIKL